MPDENGFPEYEDEGIDGFDQLDDLSAAEGIPSGDADAGGDGKGKKKGRREPKSASGKSGGGGGAGGGKAKRYTPDDIGNADRLLDEFGEDMRFDESLGEWVVWSGARWEVNGHEAMRKAMSIPRAIVRQAGQILMYDPEDKTGKAMDAWGRQCGNVGRLKSMLEVARSMPGVAVGGEGFNADKRLLACPNGALIMGKGGASFRPVKREDLTTNVTGCAYVAGARSVMWDNFLDKFLPDIELRQWAQKVAGYSMIGGNPGRKIVFCWGPTSSGKSTFAELVQEALGSYASVFNLSMLRENQDERPRPDLVQAMNQRAIFASEASSDWHLHADMIKRATGQDKMLARLPHSGVGVRKIPDFTPWIITNNIPTIKGADQALYRRLCTVLFPLSISSEDENIDFKDELIADGQLEGVLAWLVEGWKLYCAEGLGSPPHKIVIAEMRMREQFSDLDIFLAECCEVGTGNEYKEVPSDLYSRYEEWHETNGAKPQEKLSGTAFGKALNGRGFVAKNHKEGGKVVRRRAGIRLKR